MNERQKRTKRWITEQALGVCSTFRSEEDLPVHFDAYSEYQEGVVIQIIPGCKIAIYDRVYNDKGILVSFDIHCWMVAGTILNVHHHPDCNEGFAVQSGQLTDLVSKIVITQSLPHTFLAKISHHMRCDVDAFMIIKCDRV